MKNYILFLSLAFSFISHAQKQTINPVLGDKSWESMYLRFPNSQDNEKLRISTHLKYVIDSLENTKGPSNPDLLNKRENSIALLKEYVAQGVFPSNYDFPEERRPCFIDEKGNVCAVGYLVEQTAGRGEAERINTLFQYDYIKNMKDEGLLAWQGNSGLSFRELEMIQPTYDYMRNTPDMSHITVEVFYKEKEGKYGLKSKRTGKIKLAAEYDNIQLGALPGGLGIIVKGDRYGVIDKWGKIRRPLIYDRIFPHKSNFGNHLYRGNVLVAQTGKELFVINGDNEVSCYLDSIDQVTSAFEHLRVRRGEKWGMVATDGRLILKFEYDFLSDSNIGTFLVSKNDSFGIVDSEEKVIIPLKYKWVSRYAQYWKAKTMDGLLELYDEKGNRSEIDSIQELKPFGNNYRNPQVVARKNGRLGLLGGDLKWVLPPEYDKIESYLSWVWLEKNGKTGIFYGNGSSMIPVVYDSIVPTTLSFMVMNDGKMGLFSRAGKELLPCTQDTIIRLSKVNGHQSFLLGVRNNGVWKVFDDIGNLRYEDPLLEEVQYLNHFNFTLKYPDGYKIAWALRDSVSIHQESIYFTSLKTPNTYCTIYEIDGEFGFLPNQNSSPLRTELEKGKRYEKIESFNSGNAFFVKDGEEYVLLNSKAKELKRMKIESYQIPNADSFFVEVNEIGVGYYKLYSNGKTNIISLKKARADKRVEIIKD